MAPGSARAARPDPGSAVALRSPSRRGLRHETMPKLGPHWAATFLADGLTAPIGEREEGMRPFPRPSSRWSSASAATSSLPVSFPYPRRSRPRCSPLPRGDGIRASARHLEQTSRRSPQTADRPICRRGDDRSTRRTKISKIAQITRLTGNSQSLTLNKMAYHCKTFE